MELCLHDPIRIPCVVLGHRGHFRLTVKGIVLKYAALPNRPCGGNTRDFQSGAIRFEFRLGYRISRLRIFVVLLRLQANPGKVDLQIDYEPLLPNLFVGIFIVPYYLISFDLTNSVFETTYLNNIRIIRSKILF